MIRLRQFVTAALALLLLLQAGTLTSARQAVPSALNTGAIDRALGLAGQMQGDVYRVGLPRTDLKVVVDGVAVKAGLALGSWAAFLRMGDQAVVHGDLVLLEAEVNPLISKLQERGLQITALHNHLLGETPRVLYLHYWGTGPEEMLAKALHDGLATTKTPLMAAPAAVGAAPAADFDVDAIQKSLGRTGTVKNGVLSISVPRPEKIMMMGVVLPPAMGMATALNFQSDGAGKVAATGDFVMIDDEVNPIAMALRAHGIAITALHSHMLHGTPPLLFMHFWAHDSAAAVAAGLKAAVDLLAK